MPTKPALGAIVIKDSTPEKLRPYTSLGVGFTIADDEASADCPFCGRETKLNVNVTTGTFRCVVCNAGNAKGGGNIYTFLKLLHKQSMEQTTDKDYEELRISRKLLYRGTPKAWGVCRSSITGDWLVPGYSPSGALTQLYRYVKLKQGMTLLAVTGLSHALHSPDLPTPVGGNQPTKTTKRGPIFRCEGPWDGMAMWEVMAQARRSDTGGLIPTSNKELALTAQGTVIAVPGCGTFNPAWAVVLADRPDYSFYDNDHPREFPPGSGKVTQAGLDGSKRAIQVLAAAETPPSQCLYLRWGRETFHDPDLKTGYDVRDALSSAGTTLALRVKALDELLSKLIPIPQEWIPGKGVGSANKGLISADERPCESWAKLVAAAEKAQEFHAGMRRALAVCLSSIVSVPTRGDQLWVKMMGPPSCGKSVICEAMTFNRKYIVAKSTLRGFHSGFQTDKEGAEDHSMINLLRNKTLVTKDGDTLLTSPNVGQILAEARDVYDRTARTGYRNKQKRDYAGINMTWILAGTSSLRILDTSELGERFITVIVVKRMEEGMENRIALMAARHAERDCGMEAGEDLSGSDGPDMLEFKQLVAGYITHLRLNAAQSIDKIAPMSTPTLTKIVNLATFVAFLRTRQSEKQDEKTERELNFRLTKQFVRLARCLAVVLNKKTVDKEVLDMVKQCAMDTAEGKTMSICDTIHAGGKHGDNPEGLALVTGLSKEKTNDALTFLRKIGAVVVRRLDRGPVRGPARYFLSPRLSELYREIVGEASSD